MPCHRCGARQTDPVRGASPWRRGVRAGEQVLICPECQNGRDWTADLAHCAACGSARLVRVLGNTQCKNCGAEDQVLTETVPGTEIPATSRSAATTLSEDVHAALERHFGQRTE